MDITSVFLQGKNIDPEVYLELPVEAGTIQLWKFNISVYRLHHAPCSRYLSFNSVLLRAGAIKSKSDDSASFWSDKLQGVMCCDVDVFCWGGSEQFQSTTIGKIRETFSIIQEEIKTFKYLGLNIKQTNCCISSDPNLYLTN